MADRRGCPERGDCAIVRFRRVHLLLVLCLMFQVFHERLALELHMIFGFFSLDICEMVIVNRRSLVLKRRWAIADFTPMNDAFVVNLRAAHRRHDLLSVRLLTFDRAIPQLAQKLGGGAGDVPSGNGVVHNYRFLA